MRYSDKEKKGFLRDIIKTNKGTPMEMKQETALQTAKAAPAIGGALYASLTLNDVVAIVTIIYVVIQTAFLINKWFWAREDRKKDNGK